MILRKTLRTTRDRPKYRRGPLVSAFHRTGHGQRGPQGSPLAFYVRGPEAAEATQAASERISQWKPWAMPHALTCAIAPYWPRGLVPRSGAAGQTTSPLQI